MNEHPDSTCQSCNLPATQVFLEDVEEWGWSCSICERTWVAA